MGCKCELLSVIGNDLNGKILSEDLIKKNIKGLVIDSSRPTTFKKRYLVIKTLSCRELDDRPVSEEINQLISKLEKLAPNQTV